MIVIVQKKKTTMAKKQRLHLVKLVKMNSNSVLDRLDNEELKEGSETSNG